MKNAKIKLILSEVLESIQPDKDYEKEIFSRINSILKKINQNKKGIKAILGGSGAKGTWLKAFDADIFALFDYKKFRNQSDKLSDILEKVLKKKFRNTARLHGSRDYFQIKQGKFTFEIIPILKIQKAEQALNITDVSPLHSRWVARYRKLVDEMKLAKQFCRAQNVYGAESYIRGLSGYVCEILVVHYGSFLNLMKKASKWPEKTVIDVEKYYKGKDIFKIVNISKLISPLIVVDPVQKDRNAAAALSHEKFEAFKQACKEFLDNPSKDFFLKKDIKKLFLEEKSNGRNIITIEVKPLSGKIDVIGSKLLKIYEFIAEKLKQHDFKAIKNGWEWNKKDSAHFYISFDKKPLPNKIQIEGPPIKLKNHVGNFKRIHKKTFVKSGKIYAVEKRKFIAPEYMIKNLLNEPFIMERCNSIGLKIL